MAAKVSSSVFEMEHLARCQTGDGLYILGLKPKVAQLSVTNSAPLRFTESIGPLLDELSR